MKSTTCLSLIVAATMLFSTDLLRAQKDISGKQWTRMEAQEKLAYLAGFYAGLKSDSRVAAAAQKDHPTKNPMRTNAVAYGRYWFDRQDYLLPSLNNNIKSIAKLLDAFFTVDENISIVLPAAIRIVALRQEGDIQRSEDHLLQERRKALKGR